MFGAPERLVNERFVEDNEDGIELVHWRLEVIEIVSSIDNRQNLFRG